MWSYSFTGQRSRLEERQRVGFLIQVDNGISDGAFFEMLKLSVERGCRTLFCHQDSSFLCKSLFRKIGKEAAAVSGKLIEATRDDFMIGLIMSRQAYRTDVGEAALFIKQAVETLGSGYVDFLLVPWPTDNRVFTGRQSLKDAIMFNSLWRRIEQARSNLPAGFVRDVGVVDLEPWQIEAIIDPSSLGSTNRVEAETPVTRPRMHYNSELSPRKPRLHAVAFSHQQRIDVVARVTGADDPTPVTLQLAEKHGKTPLEVLLCWARQRGVVSLPLLPCNTAYKNVQGADATAQWRACCDNELTLALGLLDPLVSKPSYFAPTKKLRFVLSANEVEMLNHEHADEVLVTTQQLDVSAVPQEPEATGVHAQTLSNACEDLAMLDRPAPRNMNEDTLRESEGRAWEEKLVSKDALTGDAFSARSSGTSSSGSTSSSSRRRRGVLKTAVAMVSEHKRASVATSQRSMSVQVAAVPGSPSLEAEGQGTRSNSAPTLKPMSGVVQSTEQVS